MTGFRGVGMTPGIKSIVAGNWKMNGGRNALNEIKAVAAGLNAGAPDKPGALICPPATLLYDACAIASDTALMIGAQDCHAEMSGAHTGDISAPMIADAGATHVIVGHSERRTNHRESDEHVRRKAEAAHSQSLISIICIGETGQERESGSTLDVLARQIAGSFPEHSVAGNTILAYEPVWAIGTGLTPTLSDIEEAHAFIRQTLAGRFGAEGNAMQLLYGGSVKPDNAKEILSVQNVDGALVGGASLKSEDFLAICRAGGN